MPDIHFECPKCTQSLDAPEELANELIECPTCKETIEVPIHSRPTKTPVSVPPPLPKPQVTQPPLAIKRPSTPFPIRLVAKWVVIVWSGLCAIGLGIGFLNVMWSETQHPALGSSNQFEEAGAFLGFGVGLFIWFIIWAVIAFPVALIWLMSKKD
jgi:hypothetical protein